MLYPDIALVPAVAAVHERLISLVETAVAVRPVGAFGGVVTPVNVALTDVSAVIVFVQELVNVPEQAPPHEVKVEPELAVAVKTMEVPLMTDEGHAPLAPPLTEHEMEPLPLTETDTANWVIFTESLIDELTFPTASLAQA
jgi:hypothetical protein